MPSTSSPHLGPAYTCGSSITVLDIDDGKWGYVTTLNPTATEFTPKYYPIEDASTEAGLVDDIMKTMHHLVSVHDSDQLTLAQRFADADYTLDAQEELALDAMDDMLGGVHVPTQKPKGCTASRKGAARRERRQSREGQ